MINELEKDKSWLYINDLGKVFGVFMVLYSFIYSITLTIYYIGKCDYDKLNIKQEYYLLILDLLIYLPIFIFILFSLIYVIRYNKKLTYIEKHGGYLNKGVISLLLVYLTSFILDPFYHDFRVGNSEVFELNRFWEVHFSWEVILVLIVLPIFEELFFRDFLLRPFIKEYTFYFGIFITSFFYSISHFYITNSNYYFDYLSAIKYFLIGVVFSVLRIKNGLLYSIIAHFSYNLLGFIYSEKIINLFVLDYIESNSFYWALYILVLFIVLYLTYKLVTQVRHRLHLQLRNKCD